MNMRIVKPGEDKPINLSCCSYDFYSVSEDFYFDDAIEEPIGVACHAGGNDGVPTVDKKTIHTSELGMRQT